MFPLTRAIERSLASISGDHDDEARRQEIHKVQNPAKRISLLGLHSAVVHFPELFANKLGLPYQSPALTRLGEGVQSEVFRLDPYRVLKIIKEQTPEGVFRIFTPNERIETAAQLAQEHHRMTEHLGSVVLPHTVNIRQHPINRGQEAIQIIQPYRELTFLELYDTNESTDALRQRLATIQCTYPAAISELARSVQSSHTMLKVDRLVTDFVGDQNAGICPETQRLVIVDAQPVPPKRPDDQALAIWQLERLDAALTRLPT